MCVRDAERERNREREVGSLGLCGRLLFVCVCEVKRESNKGGSNIKVMCKKLA